MELPSAVNAYFEADRGDDAEALGRAFRADAAVRDEGAVHQGVEAIRAWWLAAKRKYRHVAEPIGVTGTGEKVSVRARVSGRFPGSPATLDFVFTLADGGIVGLDIR
ncbi:nuclear transport factor 2 family protein [Arenibaculum sp.]|jgi:hypothetical protein|uniref:nuclear transport factor 2 family protein n=1 Tax=Arenibaculum sp. TaxID=2865862 RepID=UPI002E0EF7E2|nr:nuclear transport factor 2 family protein [Arenibaculum sp.]